MAKKKRKKTVIRPRNPLVPWMVEHTKVGPMGDRLKEERKMKCRRKIDVEIHIHRPE